MHLGSAPLSVQEALSSVSMRPGDVVLLNDPFREVRTSPDLTMIAPVFLGESSSPLFYVANRAHHADVGGISAGSMPVSEEIFQEGVIIPPLRIVKEGALDEDLVSFFLANVRTPKEREGDLKAQIASLAIGIKRLQDINGRHGTEEMLLYASALKDHAERVLRALLAGIPDGDYSAQDFLDDDGFSPEPLYIKVCIRIVGDSAEIDFTGTLAQVRGNLNAVFAITVSAFFTFQIGTAW